MGEIIKFSFDAFDVHRNTQFFKDHRQYVEHRFAALGYEVTRWGWDMNPSTGRWEQQPDGIQYKRNDSDIDLSIEVTGVVGKNLRKLIVDAARD